MLGDCARFCGLGSAWAVCFFSERSEGRNMKVGRNP